ncbi:hypothetical protein, partial [Streptomyces lunaelactis]|uniref:hypothetical protein n=1 Tax=Streptomyces lunaelactis TaxID=1535768 RepID=UPI0020C7660F
MSESEAALKAKRILEAAYRPEPTPSFPTSFRDDSPVPRFGTTPPVHQDDRRIVPAWAAGIAVASIGVGAGVTGIGCGTWLVLQGLASVTLYGVLMVTLRQYEIRSDELAGARRRASRKVMHIQDGQEAGGGAG